jgi:hypothetical protein
VTAPVAFIDELSSHTVVFIFAQLELELGENGCSPLPHRKFPLSHRYPHFKTSLLSLPATWAAFQDNPVFGYWVVDVETKAQFKYEL